MIFPYVQPEPNSFQEYYWRPTPTPFHNFSTTPVSDFDTWRSEGPNFEKPPQTNSSFSLLVPNNYFFCARDDLFRTGLPPCVT